MGLLDDAIREHLELKRRRGADPSEVDRLEREALGPVRRAPREATEVISDEERAPAGGYPFDEEASSTGSYLAEEELSDWADSPGEFDPYDRNSESSLDEPSPSPSAPDPSQREFGPASGSGYEFEPEPDQERRARHHEIAEEWEAHGRREFAGQPAGLEPDLPAPAAPPPPASANQPPADAPDFEKETAEYRLEDDERLAEPESEEPGEGEDMLEETPDFLQDTPDHDRLWFEQRPPRDFDFDG